MSKCSDCGVVKTSINTYICSGRLASYCKKCVKNRVKASFDRRGRSASKKANDRRKAIIDRSLAFVNKVKLHYGCCLCPKGTSYPVECLDCHHFDSAVKDANIAYLVRLTNNKKLLQELVKCVVVCANCHRQIHTGKLTPDKSFLISLDGLDTSYNDNPKGKRKRK